MSTSLRLRYAGYPSTALGPPDPEEWVGPTGPAGATGATGPQGPPGATGPAGSSGAGLGVVNIWSAAQRGAVVTLTDAATVASDFSLGNNFTVTLAGNRTLGLPTNLVAGQAGQIVVKQDATGARTLAYNSVWKFRSGAPPVLSTPAGALDILSYYVVDAVTIAVSVGTNFT